MRTISLKPLLSRDQINERVKELGTVISKDYKDLNPVLIAVLNGSFIFAGDLVRNMNIVHEIDFIKISSYTNGGTSGDISLMKDLSADISAREVIIVEDIIDTGRSLSFLEKHIAQYNPSDVKKCALIDKKERREVKNISATYTGFEINEGFLVGYGMDYKGWGRNINGIYKLDFKGG